MSPPNTHKEENADKEMVGGVQAFVMSAVPQSHTQ